MKSGYKVILFLFSTLFLSACGGGSINSDGSSGSNNNSNYDTHTITLTLTNSSGVSISEVSQETPGVLTALVKKNNQVLANKRVNFALDGKGALGVDSALTNAEGVASIDLLPGDQDGAGTVTAMITTDASASLSESLDFSTVGDGSSSDSEINISLKLIDAEGNPVSTINSVTPATVVATVTGGDSQVIVQFSTSRGSFPIDAVATNDGVASAKILAGTEPGAGIITASLSTGETSEYIFTVGATN